MKNQHNKENDELLRIERKAVNAATKLEKNKTKKSKEELMEFIFGSSNETNNDNEKLS